MLLLFRFNCVQFKLPHQVIDLHFLPIDNLIWTQTFSYGHHDILIFLQLRNNEHSSVCKCWVWKGTWSQVDVILNKEGRADNRFYRGLWSCYGSFWVLSNRDTRILSYLYNGYACWGYLGMVRYGVILDASKILFSWIIPHAFCFFFSNRLCLSSVSL